MTSYQQFIQSRSAYSVSAADIAYAIKWFGGEITPEAEQYANRLVETAAFSQVPRLVVAFAAVCKLHPKPIDCVGLATNTCPLLATIAHFAQGYPVCE